MINDNSEFDAHEAVVFCHDKSSGLDVIIAIHDTSAGPAMGGCRMASYTCEKAALTDVLRLSKGMSYKNIMAGLPYGGGKAVIIANPATHKTPALLKTFAHQVERLGGNFITSIDVGVSVPDVQIMRTVTQHVRGIAANGPGDPSSITARGVFESMKVAVKHALNRDNLEGIGVHVQGLGGVGMQLSALLAKDGARLIVSDINGAKCDEAKNLFGAAICPSDHWYEADAEVYAPCALGAMLNEQTIPKLKSIIVTGAANNQLAHPEDGNRLYDRGILYAPDYVVNAGGVISIAFEGPTYDYAALDNHMMEIPKTLQLIFDRAKVEKMPTAIIADQIARERLGKA